MGTFSGTLNSNEINNALYNMIISQQVFSDNIAGTYSSLVDQAKVEAGLFGDKKLYYATDCTKTHEWLNDSEAANLLSLDRNKEVSIQEIVINKFRQIRTTVDSVLSKKAWMEEGSFSSYNSILLGWMRETKRIHDSRMYNVFIGTNKSPLTTGKQNITVTLPVHASSETNVEAEACNRLRGQKLAKFIADLIVDMKDATRDYNDYKYMRSYDEGGLKFIWNADYLNSIEKIDLPTIFHKEGLVQKLGEEVLPGKYFGTPNAAKILAADNDGSYRSMEEADFTVGTVVTHCFAGDLIPAGCDINIGKGYAVDAKVICKVVKILPPLMSSFEISTSFYNPRSLTTNHYLTYGYNTLEHLKNYPFITIKEA